MIPVPKLKDHTFALGGSRLGPSRLEDEDRQEDLGILVFRVCLDPFVKLSIVDCSSAQKHTHSMFGFGFHELIDQNKFTCFICILDVLYIHTCLYDLYKLSLTNLFM